MVQHLRPYSVSFSVAISLSLSKMDTVANADPPAGAPVSAPGAFIPTRKADTTQTQNGGESYPLPQARYEEVVASAGLFMETLERLHRLMGTKFKVPTIGGKALDLHRLFVEVTSRGGLEKVIKDRKWRDVIAMFNFPSTITSASFVLRKYYVSLLHHYEQVYFFRNKGFSSSLDASQPVGALATSQAEVARTQSQVKGTKRHRMEGYTLQDGSLVTGKITGKFDHGYLVTANFGSERLIGVLYHVPFGRPDQNISYLKACRHRRKKSWKTMKDPSRPKSNRSGYNFFFAEQYARLKPSHSGEESAITKQIGHLWNNLTATEKEVYQEKGIRDKERYMSEMLEYKKSSNPS